MLAQKRTHSIGEGKQPAEWKRLLLAGFGGFLFGDSPLRRYRAMDTGLPAQLAVVTGNHTIAVVCVLPLQTIRQPGQQIHAFVQNRDDQCRSLFTRQAKYVVVLTVGHA